MSEGESVKVDGRGAVQLPSELRRRFDIDEGSVLIAEATDEGILLRPSTSLVVEQYTPERRAEFLLNNAVDAEDYAWASEEVRRMGMDPATVPHRRPPG